jgi:hypothetical protein
MIEQFYTLIQWRNGTSEPPPPPPLSGAGKNVEKIFRTIFLKNKVLIFWTMTSKKVTKNFRYPCLPKRGSKFHNFTNSYLRGPPVANFLTLYNSGSDQFSQCTSNNFVAIFARGLPGVGAPRFWASKHPPVTPLLWYAYSISSSFSYMLQFNCNLYNLYRRRTRHLDAQWKLRIGLYRQVTEIPSNIYGEVLILTWSAHLNQAFFNL